MLKCLIIYNKKNNAIKDKFFYSEIQEQNENFKIEKLCNKLKEIKYKNNERVKLVMKDIGIWYTEKSTKNNIFCVLTENNYKERFSFEFIKNSITSYNLNNFNEINELLKKYYKIENVDNITRLNNKVNRGISEAKETYATGLLYNENLDDFREIVYEVEENAHNFENNTLELNNEMKKRNRKITILLIIFIGILVIILIIIPLLLKSI